MTKDIYLEMPGSQEKTPVVRVASLHGSESGSESQSRKITPFGRRRTTAMSPENYDGEQDTQTKLGPLYAKFRGFNVITRNLVYILPVSIVLAVPLIIFDTVAKDARAGGVRLLGLFIWLQVMWWCLWCTKYFAQLLPYVFRFFCGFVSAGTRKYMLVIKALEIPISLVLWAVTCWATVPIITCFDQPHSFHWVFILRRVLLASIAVAALLLAEKLIIQLISINYGRRQFNARLIDSKQRIAMLDTLYGASISLFPANNSPDFKDVDYLIATGAALQQKQDTNAQFMDKLNWVNDNMHSVVGDVTGELTGSQKNIIHEVVIGALEKKHTGEALGRRVWLSLAGEGKDALYREDIHDILGRGRKAEADVIFDLLDADKNGDISLDEMVMMVLNIAFERRALNKSMHDVGQAVKVLDRFFSAVLLICLAVIYAAFFSNSFAKYLFTIGSQIAAFGFAISATVQEFLGSCIFVFIKHPYDVGDRVLISDTQMTVEHISLLYTQFKRIDNNRIVQISNIKVNDLMIENVTRSNSMREQVPISVHAETSFADIEVLKNELLTFVSTDENKRDFFPDVEIQIMEVKDLKSIELLVGVSHKSNWANEMLRQTRRNKLMTAVLSSLRTVPIYPAGADKPLAIRRVTTEEVDAARELVSADKAAVQVLRKEDELESEYAGASSGIEVHGQAHNRLSMDTVRTHDARRPAVGLRRAGHE